jgi:hypothetical protein
MEQSAKVKRQNFLTNLAGQEAIEESSIGAVRPATTSDALKLVNEAEHVTITQLRSSSPAQPPREFDGMRT